MFHTTSHATLSTTQMKRMKQSWIENKFIQKSPMNSKMHLNGKMHLHVVNLTILNISSYYTVVRIHTTVY